MTNTGVDSPIVNGPQQLPEASQARPSPCLPTMTEDGQGKRGGDSGEDGESMRREEEESTGQEESEGYCGRLELLPVSSALSR